MRGSSAPVRNFVSANNNIISFRCVWFGEEEDELRWQVCAPSPTTPQTATVRGRPSSYPTVSLEPRTPHGRFCSLFATAVDRSRWLVCFYLPVCVWTRGRYEHRLTDLSPILYAQHPYTDQVTDTVITGLDLQRKASPCIPRTMWQWRRLRNQKPSCSRTKPNRACHRMLR